MPATAEQTELSVRQVDRVLAAALRAGFVEPTATGDLPTNVAVREEIAQEMVRQCRLGVAAGNQNGALRTILGHVEAQVEDQTTIEGEDMSVTTQENDLTAHPTALLGKLLTTLGNYDAAPERDSNIALIQAEVNARAGRGDAAAVEIAGAWSTGTAEQQPAVAVAAAQEPPSAVAVAAPQANADRASLENQITFTIMRAHSIDPSQIDQLTDEQLRWYVAHPSPQIGPAAPESVALSESPAAQQPSGADVDSASIMPNASPDAIETTRMVVEKPVAAAPPATKTAAKREPDVSEERLALEEQVTGKMLKNFGQGRDAVADGTIGDNELAFMIAHPDGQVSMEDLKAAKALDAQGMTIAEQMRAAKQEAEVSDPAEQQMRALENEPESGDAFDFVMAQPEPAAPVVAEALPAQKPAPAERGPLLTDLPESHAREIIERENFPIPPVIPGDQPRLPFDLSKLSDAEIRSYHSICHAWHSRANYVTGLWEQELRDEVKLRRKREIDVMNALPIKEGNSKLTDAQREARVAADPEVMEHREKEHEIEGVARQLRQLADTYSRDVAVCSRQFARREDEASGA
jgi:hypothetical protein